jgi:hypothetical protein
MVNIAGAYFAEAVDTQYLCERTALGTLRLSISRVWSTWGISALVLVDTIVRPEDGTHI